MRGDCRLRALRMCLDAGERCFFGPPDLPYPAEPVWKLSFGFEGEVAGRSIKLDASRLR
jgi:hypothetical protein